MSNGQKDRASVFATFVEVVKFVNRKEGSWFLTPVHDLRQSDDTLSEGCSGVCVSKAGTFRFYCEHYIAPPPGWVTRAVVAIRPMVFSEPVDVFCCNKAVDVKLANSCSKHTGAIMRQENQQ